MKTMMRFATAAAVLSAAAGAAAQSETTTVPGFPPPPLPILALGDDVASAPDAGCLAVGSGLGFSGLQDMSAVRFDAAGQVVWETRYLADPSLGLSLRTTSTQWVSTDKGWVLAAEGSEQRPEDPCYPLAAAVLRIKDSGELAWGVRFAADFQEGWLEYKFAPYIQVREMPDGTFVAVTARPPRDPGDCRPICAASKGAAIHIDRDGTVLWCYEYDVNGLGDKSRVGFIDLAVYDGAIFVLGEMDEGDACSPRNHRPIVLGIDEGSGAVFSSYELVHTDGRDRWATAACNREKTLYLSASNNALDYDRADSLLTAFDFSSNSILWARELYRYHIDYGNLKLDWNGDLISGGHDFIGNARAGLFSGVNGATQWYFGYADPNSPLTEIERIRGVSPSPSLGYWLLGNRNSGQLYLIGTAPGSAGKAVCSHRELPLENVRTRVRPLPIRMETKELAWREFRPETLFLNSVAEEPCRGH